MKHLFLTLAVCGLLSACATTLEMQTDGFEIQQDTITLKQPPEGQARIYAFRPSRFAGGGVRYFVSGHYNKFTYQRPFANLDDTFFILRSENGAGNFVDIERLEPITLYAQTEAAETLSFTPVANRIYCLRTSVIPGAWVGRPKFDLLSQKTCEQEIKSINMIKQYEKQKQHAKIFWQKVEQKAKKQ